MPLTPGPKLGPYEILSPLAAGGMGQVIVSSPFRNTRGRVSPDGRFLAYLSNESGRFELYVRTFSPGSSGSGGKWQISTGGCAFSSPRWRSDGKELFYRAVDQRLMAVSIKTDSGVQAGTATPLFEVAREWDVRADGQRFLVAMPSQWQAAEPLQVVLNWTALLPKRK